MINTSIKIKKIKSVTNLTRQSTGENRIVLLTKTRRVCSGCEYNLFFIKKKTLNSDKNQRLQMILGG
jgi:hypothetical protein